MPEHNDQINHINQILLETMRPIYQSQKLIYDSMSSSRAIQESINKMMRPYREFSEKLLKEFSKPFSSLADGISKRIAEEMAESFKSFDSLQMDKEFAESIQRMIRLCSAPELINVSIGHVYDFPDDLGGLSDYENDFVTVDESVVKEYEILGDFSFSCGCRRFKINTGNFLALIGIIISLFSFTYQQLSSDKCEDQNIQVEQTQNQILLLQNQVLFDIFRTIDVTSSSQAEELQSLKESVEAQNIAISGLEESLDSIQQSLDNMSESENTESEK